MGFGAVCRVRQQKSVSKLLTLSFPLLGLPTSVLACVSLYTAIFSQQSCHCCHCNCNIWGNPFHITEIHIPATPSPLYCHAVIFAFLHPVMLFHFSVTPSPKSMMSFMHSPYYTTCHQHNQCVYVYVSAKQFILVSYNI